MTDQEIIKQARKLNGKDYGKALEKVIGEQRFAAYLREHVLKEETR